MIVKYIKEQIPGKEDPHFIFGKEYLVIGVRVSIDGENYFCIQYKNEESPALFDTEFFEIVDPRIPPNYVFSKHYRGMSLDPQEFEGDFWDHYYDYEEKALKTFDEVIYRLKKFHNWVRDQPVLDDSYLIEEKPSWAIAKALYHYDYISFDMLQNYAEELIKGNKEEQLSEEIAECLWASSKTAVKKCVTHLEKGADMLLLSRCFYLVIKYMWNKTFFSSELPIKIEQIRDVLRKFNITSSKEAIFFNNFEDEKELNSAILNYIEGVSSEK